MDAVRELCGSFVGWIRGKARDVVLLYHSVPEWIWTVPVHFFILIPCIVYGMAFWSNTCLDAYAAPPIYLSASQVLAIVALNGLVVIPVTIARVVSGYHTILYHWMFFDCVSSLSIACFAMYVYNLILTSQVNGICVVWSSPDISPLVMTVILTMQWVSYTFGLWEIFQHDRQRRKYLIQYHSFIIRGLRAAETQANRNLLMNDIRAGYYDASPDASV